MSNTTTPQDYYVSAYSGEEHDEAVGAALGAVRGAVRYDAAQALTAAQQHTAQKNIGTTWPCNPNLLDNWCFLPGCVVNQRGQTSYSGSGYGIDMLRLIIATASIQLTSDGLKIPSAGSGGVAGFPVYNVAALAGRQVTLSVLGSQTNGGYLTTSANGEYINDMLMPASTGIASSTFTLPADLTSLWISVVDWDEAKTGYSILKAIKLELGDQQTLAHQDADGNWVLNEIPNYAEQLARCQRYAVELNAHNLEYPMIGIGQARSSTSISVVVPMAAMRAAPSIQTDWAKWSCGNRETFLAVSNGFVNADGAGSIQLFLSVSGATPGAVYEVGMTGYGKALLTAEL